MRKGKNQSKNSPKKVKIQITFDQRQILQKDSIWILTQYSRRDLCVTHEYKHEYESKYIDIKKTNHSHIIEYQPLSSRISKVFNVHVQPIGHSHSSIVCRFFVVQFENETKLHVQKSKQNTKGMRFWPIEFFSFIFNQNRKYRIGNRSLQEFM